MRPNRVYVLATVGIEVNGAMRMTPLGCMPVGAGGEDGEFTGR